MDIPRKRQTATAILFKPVSFKRAELRALFNPRGCSWRPFLFCSHTRQQANTAITSKLKNNQVRSNCGATIMESFAIESRRHVCAEILSHCNDPVVPFNLNYAVERSWFWCGRNAEKEKASRTQQRFVFDGTGWAGHVGMLMWYRLSIFYYIAEAKGPKTKVFPENTCFGCWLLAVACLADGAVLSFSFVDTLFVQKGKISSWHVQWWFHSESRIVTIATSEQHMTIYYSME